MRAKGGRDTRMKAARWGVGVVAFCAAAWLTAVPGWPASPAHILTYAFARAHIPSAPGESTTLTGRVGGLVTTLSLTAGATASSGRFVISVKGLGAAAGARFGQLRGTFACSGGRCSLTVGAATGVFSKVRTTTLGISSIGPAAGMLATTFATQGAWVSAVAHAAAELKADGALPEGVTVGDLVSEAAHDGKPGPEGSAHEKPTGGGEGNSGGKGGGDGGGKGGGKGGGH